AGAGPSDFAAARRRGRPARGRARLRVGPLCASHVACDERAIDDGAQGEHGSDAGQREIDERAVARDPPGVPEGHQDRRLVAGGVGVGVGGGVGVGVGVGAAGGCGVGSAGMGRLSPV
ncbi:MAG: hypothetical protein WCI78_06955, partial [Mycobacterium sp.]